MKVLDFGSGTIHAIDKTSSVSIYSESRMVVLTFECKVLHCGLKLSFEIFSITPFLFKY